MPSSELKYCHLIPGLDFKLSASTGETERRGGGLMEMKEIRREQEGERQFAFIESFSSLDLTFNVTVKHNLLQEGERLIQL